MARQCHLNTCPVGIATRRNLAPRFNGKPEMVVAYFRSSPKKFAATWRNWASVRSPNFAAGTIASKQNPCLDALLVISRLQAGRVVPQQTPVPESSGVGS